MREVRVAAGVRTRIVGRRFNSIPSLIAFEAEAADGRGEPSGRVEVRGSRWVFPKPPLALPLARLNRVRKGFWDTWFDVYVIPDRDVIVRLRGAAIPPIVWVAAAMVVAAAAAVFVVTRLL